MKAKKKLIDKLLKLRQDTEEIMSFKKGGGTRVGGSESGEVHHTLFVENLSKVTLTQVLNEIFMKCPGFKEIRHIPEKCVAFAEFDSVD